MFNPALASRPLWTPWLLGGQVAAWFDATAGITLNSGNVAQWQSKSSAIALVQVTGAAQPVFTPNGLNNRPAVQFTHSSTSMTAAFSLAQPSTIYAMVRPTNIQAYSLVVGSASSATNSSIQFRSAGGHFAYFAGSIVESGITVNNNNTYLAGAVFNGASSIGSLNGTTVAGNPGSSGITTPLQMNVAWAGGVDMDGYWSEMAFVRAALSAPDRQKLEGYMARNGAVQLASGHPFQLLPPRAAAEDYEQVEPLHRGNPFWEAEKARFLRPTGRYVRGASGLYVPDRLAA